MVDSINGQCISLRLVNWKAFIAIDVDVQSRMLWIVYNANDNDMQLFYEV